MEQGGQEVQGAEEELQDVIQLDMEEEAQLAGGDDTVGCGGMEERLVGSIAIVGVGPTMADPISSNPEVQGAIDHLIHVRLGVSPPARAILIRPLPTLSNPPPAPPVEATPQFSRVVRRPLEKELAPVQPV